jgi:hypothetical protein
VTGIVIAGAVERLLVQGCGDDRGDPAGEREAHSLLDGLEGETSAISGQRPRPDRLALPVGLQEPEMSPLAIANLGNGLAQAELLLR